MPNDSPIRSTYRQQQLPGFGNQLTRRWLPQYTSRAAQLYKATLEKDVKKLSALPVSPTAAEAAKQGIDFLDSEVCAVRRIWFYLVISVTYLIIFSYICSILFTVFIYIYIDLLYVFNSI